ncbi:helix-turn-helix domain-containing protein [Pseudoalteromonas neustonica]|uniref:helix-turn-helix domain-containing protein n=1 Tax=Pseudoalteromonas neustonica TaxID=1840331 RepID=UPI0007DB23CA|nr:helix-turn-helix domain-containing protein [Pseudoalteromonas neustonica]
MLGKTLTAEQQQVSDIFKRLRDAYGVNKNAALERHLSLSNSFCTNTINRGSIPYQLIHQTCLATNFSFDYLLNGTDDLDLVTIENGLLKSLSALAGSGFIKGDNNNVGALRKLAKIQCEYVEKEFAIQKDNN